MSTVVFPLEDRIIVKTHLSDYNIIFSILFPVVFLSFVALVSTDVTVAVLNLILSVMTNAQTVLVVIIIIILVLNF